MKKIVVALWLMMGVSAVLFAQSTTGKRVTRQMPTAEFGSVQITEFEDAYNAYVDTISRSQETSQDEQVQALLEMVDVYMQVSYIMRVDDCVPYFTVLWDINGKEVPALAFLTQQQKIVPPGERIMYEEFLKKVKEDMQENMKQNAFEEDPRFRP